MPLFYIERSQTTITETHPNQYQHYQTTTANKPRKNIAVVYQQVYKGSFFAITLLTQILLLNRRKPGEIEVTPFANTPEAATYISIRQCDAKI